MVKFRRLCAAAAAMLICLPVAGFHAPSVQALLVGMLPAPAPAPWFLGCREIALAGACVVVLALTASRGWR